MSLYDDGITILKEHLLEYAKRRKRFLFGDAVGKANSIEFPENVLRSIAKKHPVEGNANVSYSFVGIVLDLMVKDRLLYISETRASVYSNTYVKLYCYVE